MQDQSAPAVSPPATTKEARQIKLLFKIGLVILIPIIFTLVGDFLLIQRLSPLPLILTFAGSLISFFLIRSFLKPLEKIADGVKLFSRGEFDHKININSSDEFGMIASELNRMALSLSAHTKAVNSSKANAYSDKNRLSSIFSSISDGIIAVDIHRQIILFNAASERLTGYRLSEVLGKRLDEIIRFLDKSGQALNPDEYCPIDLGNVNSIKNFSSADILNLIGKGGLSHPVKLKSQAIENSGSDLGCVLILTDSSKEKEFEAIQLDFVSMASHELRTPLTSVIGYLSIFIKENKGSLNAHQSDFLNRILVGAQQLGAIIDNLLSVSKVERGAFSITSGDLDWKGLLEKCVQDNQIQAIQKNITLKLSLADPNLPHIQGDPVRLSEVLNNLISNAINYTKEGGEISVTSQVSGNEIITSVKDNGEGIPQEALPHLFTKFFRVSGALDKSSNSKGTGLGLYISKSVIDLHHGRIWAQSELGKGSTFFFSLPLAASSFQSIPSQSGSGLTLNA